MGNTFTISTWEFVEYPLKSEWKYMMAWQGNSALIALFMLIKFRFKNKNCVKLEWRG